MDRDKSKETKKSTSLLHKLTRRSTKVEPQQNHTETCGGPISGSVSAHSSPINQFRQTNIRRHSSTQNISSIDHQDILPAEHTENCIVKKTKYPNNRFSHQFSLCCSIDDKMATPPVSVRYNSIADGKDKKSTSYKELETKNHDQYTNGGGNLTTTIATVHTLPDTIDNCIGHAPDDKSKNEENGIKTNTSIKDKPKPVFNEYQSSIAMSACRSRLRQKLLPPGGNTEFTGEQHFSSPNISAGVTPEPVIAEPSEGNRSLSYDILTGVKRPASADSLAKQSLIAAQLLNLIPAEKVRERYEKYISSIFFIKRNSTPILFIFRNFVAGRLAVNSLFGAAELDKVLPSREIKIYVGTWNMNGQNPPKYVLYIS